MSKKFPKKSLWIVILIFIIAIIFIPKLLPTKTETKKELSPQKKNLSVDYLIVNFEKFDDFIYSNGSILPDEEVDLRSEISGKLDKIYFSEGSFVKKGSLLFKINDDEYQAQMNKLKTKLSLAELKEKRQKALLDKQGISQEEYDISLNELMLIKSDINELETKIKKTLILAPFDGIIGLRWVSEGAYVSPSTKLALIQKIKPLKIEFSLPQEYAFSLNLNSPIDIIIPNSQEELNAKIYAFESRINNNTRTLLVRALLNTNSGLMPGSYVKVRYKLNKDKNVFLIPSDIVVPEANGETVFKFKNGKAIQTVIKTGNKTDSLVEVIEGINQGDTIISSAIIQLRDGSPVKLKGK